MDYTAIIFAVVLIIGFIALRLIIKPLPETNDFNIDTSTLSKDEEPTSSSSGITSGKSRHRRPVTDSMIEVVLTIAPTLTEEQIRLDLEKTGSVEATIDNYMANGNLPQPLKGDTTEG